MLDFLGSEGTVEAGDFYGPEGPARLLNELFFDAPAGAYE
jgi:hypothetical protein